MISCPDTNCVYIPRWERRLNYTKVLTVGIHACQGFDSSKVKRNDE